MMKKISKIAALLAAGALLLGAASCSHDSGDSLSTLGAVGGGGAGGDDDEEEEGDSVSYDFADLSAADFTTLGVTVTGSNDIKIATPNTAATPYKVLGGKVGIVTTVENKLSVKPKDGVPLAIGVNGNGVTNAAAVGDSATLVHFITYPVELGKKYKMEITSGGQANNTQHKFVVTDTTGKVLALKDCISSTTDAVTLSFEAAEEKVCLSVLRTNSSGTSYVGKVTITEISGGSNDPAAGPDGDDDEEDEDEEPEADYSMYTVDYASVDFTKLSANESLVEAKSTDYVQIGSTEFYAISGTSGGAITLKTQKDIMSLCFAGSGGVDKNAVYFTAKKGKALVTVSYHGNADRYVKVCNAGMDTVTPPSSLLTTGNGDVKTRNIEIEVPTNDTKIYLGSASSGIYITAISVKYQAEE